MKAKKEEAGKDVDNDGECIDSHLHMQLLTWALARPDALVVLILIAMEQRCYLPSCHGDGRRLHSTARAQERTFATGSWCWCWCWC